MGDYRHNQSGNIYVLLAVARNCTNNRADEKSAVYHLKNKPNELYIREINEFNRKFTPIK